MMNAMTTTPSTEPVTTALLVEDDDRLATLVTEYLNGHGVVVTRATRGDDGLRMAVAQRYDVVLLDLMLPGMDGIEVGRQLRGRSDRSRHGLLLVGKSPRIRPAPRRLLLAALVGAR